MVCPAYNKKENDPPYNNDKKFCEYLLNSVKELTWLDLGNEPFSEMMALAEDLAGHLTEGWRKFTI